MSDALAGWYTDVVYLKKAGIARISVEIPLDLWEQHQAVLGIPPAFDVAKKYLAITRISEEAFKRWAGASAPEGLGSAEHPGDGIPASSSLAGTSAVEPEGQSKARQYTLSQLAAIKLQDPVFVNWLKMQYCDKFGLDFGESLDPDRLLKRLIGIVSKKELDENPYKAGEFSKFLTSFDVRAYAR